jgi:hypothetical protein
MCPTLRRSRRTTITDDIPTDPEMFGVSQDEKAPYVVRELGDDLSIIEVLTRETVKIVPVGRAR